MISQTVTLPVIPPGWEQTGRLQPSMATHTYHVTLEVQTVLCGGLDPNSEEQGKRPWPERIEALRQIAAEMREETAPEDTSLITVFRRWEAALALSAGQIRSLLQEAAQALYTGQAGYFSLRFALRRNMVITPTLLPLSRDGARLTEPDGILDMPRPIRKPPFERSIIQRPEYLRPPIQIQFALSVAEIAAGGTLQEQVLRYMLEYAGQYIGLGAHRGQDFGRFILVDWRSEEHKSAATPPRLRDTRRKAAAATEEAQSG